MGVLVVRVRARAYPAGRPAPMSESTSIINGVDEMRVMLAVTPSEAERLELWSAWRADAEAGWRTAEVSGRMAAETRAGRAPTRGFERRLRSQVRAEALALRAERWPRTDDVVADAVRARLAEDDLAGLDGPMGVAEEQELRLSGRWPAVSYGGRSEPIAVTLPAPLVRGGRRAAARYSADALAELRELAADAGLHSAVYRERARQLAAEEAVLTWAEIVRQAIGRDHWTTAITRYGYDPADAAVVLAARRAVREAPHPDRPDGALEEA